MMKFLKTANKMIEGLLWLYMPLVLFYWALTPINLSAVLPLKALLGQIIDPLISILEEYFVFSIPYQDTNISYTHLILAGTILLAIVLTVVNGKLLELTEDTINKIKMKISQKSLQKEREKEWQSVQEELDKNKHIYVMLRVIKLQEHDEYLVKSDDSAFSVGLIDSYTTSIINLAKKFSGKEYKEYDSGPDTSNYVFTDTEKFLQYLKFLSKKMSEINKGTAELNTIFNFEMACTCSYSLTTIETDLSLTGKVLKLANKGEILVTDLLKNKMENIKTTFNIKLEPKGLYMLNEKYVDIFQLKFEEG